MSKIVRFGAVVVLLTAVAACGQRAELGSETMPTGTPGASVTWPPAGCDSMSAMAIDYVSDATGYSTREEAALAAVPTGVSVVGGPQPQPHTRQEWIVLDGEGAPVAAVEMWHAQNGYLVDMVYRCARLPQK